ncbi:MAG: hypothetical protein H8E20_02705 [Verrucomicrobia bacterium]|nr:hypothetical protein [Verrucomicrobiota bacterium]
MNNPGKSLSPAKRLAALNLLALLTAGSANIGLIFLNIWIVEELGFNIPLFPLVMIGTALGCILFWLWCASRLRLDRAGIRRCAIFAALPWWSFGLLALAATMVSVFTAEDTMKAAGWGFLTALGLAAGTACFVVHLIAAKPHDPEP